MSGSSLREFLADTFSGLTDGEVAASDCWIARGLLGRGDTAPFDDLLTAVAEAGELDAFHQRCSQAHPLDRPHRPDHDTGLINCWTEACALAWAAERFERAVFRSLQPGVPDVFVEPATWVEAKYLSPSDVDRNTRRRLLDARGNPINIAVGELHATFFKKLDDGFADAAKKFGRCGAIGRIVFFNITIDLSVLLWEDDIWVDLAAWAEHARVVYPNTGVVLCDNYGWRSPRYTSLPPLTPEVVKAKGDPDTFLERFTAHPTIDELMTRLSR